MTTVTPADFRDTAARLYSAAKAVESEAAWLEDLARGGGVELPPNSPGVPLSYFWLVECLSQRRADLARLRYSAQSNRDGTWGKNGCFVACFYTVYIFWRSFLSPDDLLLSPVEFAAELDQVGAFRGNYCSYPGNWAKRRLEADPNDRLAQEMRVDKTRRPQNWIDYAADLDVLKSELARGPFPVGVDFSPARGIQPHWIVMLWLDAEGRDALIMDPWRGVITSLARDYAAIPQPGVSLVGRVVVDMLPLGVVE